MHALILFHLGMKSNEYMKKYRLNDEIFLIKLEKQIDFNFERFIRGMFDFLFPMMKTR